MDDIPKIWRGRGRASPITGSRVSRSPSLSTPTTSSSDSSVARMGESFEQMSTRSSPEPLGPRGRSPVESRGTIRRGFRESAGEYVTRPKALLSKKGTSGYGLDLLVNYFVLKKATAWSLYQYRVDFNPDTDFTKAKKAWLYQHRETLGGYIYDGGSMLFTSTPYPQKEFQLYSTDKMDPVKKIVITIREVSQLEPGDVMYIQFYNILLKKCLRDLKLKEMGRGHFDTTKLIEYPEFKVGLFPGFLTSIRQHENDVLLCVETTHKIFRQDTVVNVMDDAKNNARGGDWKDTFRDNILDSVIMTLYNKNTYHIADIAWNLSPQTTFERRGEKCTVAQYMKERYDLQVTRMDQPLLVAKPSKKDLHRRKGEEDLPIYLIPEFCVMTGLSDSMRANFQLMKKLNDHLFMGPPGRVKELNKFMSSIHTNPDIKSYMKDWGVEFESRPVICQGRTLPPESIYFAAPKGESPFPAGDKADWTMAFRSRQLLNCPTLTKWALIVPERDAGNVDNLITTMIKVAKPLGFNIPRPAEIIKTRPGISNYMRVLEQAVRGNLDMLFVILPNNKLDLYAAVKRKLSAEVGIVSQCFLAKNVMSKGLMSIATKVVIQIAAKLGGEPWTVQIPPKKMMVVGVDVYHGTKATKGQNVVAMVSSYSQTFASYYNTTSFYTNTDELARVLCSDLTKSLAVYKETNGEYPDKIIFYRAGVGDGHLETVIMTELKSVQETLNELYSKENLEPAKFTYVVVSKKHNTRLFTTGGREAGNPGPGTICDDVVTLPERYDFYLIPQTARQGAVSPSAYNVLYDSQNLHPDRLQRLTFKYCHLYFNWSGTVAVPAPCQYAQKLAALTGTAIGATHHSQLSYNLHFL